ncbi:MAG: TIR domain-containing protein [Bifidobacteriaceae bacterium]|jgi:hypothetical protein|nr:TIR domain-containing protein [Bifidobacteriaceae bacterium]
MQVFISYRRPDNATYHQIAERLADELPVRFEAETGTTLEVFIDRDMRGGERWYNRLEREIDSSGVFIPVLTLSYFNSEVCLKELEWFLNKTDQTSRRLTILPIVLAAYDEITNRSNPNPVIATVAHLNCRDARPALRDALQGAAWARLMDDLTKDLVQVWKHPPTAQVPTPPSSQSTQTASVKPPTAAPAKSIIPPPVAPRPVQFAPPEAEKEQTPSAGRPGPQPSPADINRAQSLLDWAVEAELAECREAVTELRQLTTRFPDSQDINLGLAMGLTSLAFEAELAECREAVTELRRIATRFPDSQDINRELAIGLVSLTIKTELAECREAVTELRQLATRFPDSQGINLRLAMGLASLTFKAELAECREAVTELRRIASRFPDDPEISFQLAQGLIDLTKKDRTAERSQAITELRQLADRFPGPKGIRVRLGIRFPNY